jgi:hypothetical protein
MSYKDSALLSRMAVQGLAVDSDDGDSASLGVSTPNEFGYIVQVYERWSEGLQIALQRLGFSPLFISIVRQAAERECGVWFDADGLQNESWPTYDWGDVSTTAAVKAEVAAIPWGVHTDTLQREPDLNTH